MAPIANYEPTLTGNELKYIKECIDTRWVSSAGPYVNRFEKEFAAYHGKDAAVAVASGTAALHLGLLAVGVKRGDYVISPTLTFIGSVNPIRYCGADPIFIDVDENHLAINTDDLRTFLQTQTKKTKQGLVYKKDKRPIRAIMVVHLYGHPAAMDEILTLAKQYRLAVVEDAAESLGARYKNRLVGTMGDVGCFSFNGNKIITTGGGGMILSSDTKKLNFCKHLSTQAKKEDPFTFFHDAMGFNYRLSNISAAFGVAQMESLNEFIEKKHKQAQFYRELFSDDDKCQILQESENCRSTYWMILLQFKKGTKDIFNNMRALAAKGVGIRAVWFPIHKLPLYKDAVYYGGRKAEKIYQSTFCLPSSVNLTQDDMQRVAQLIKDI